MLCCGDEHCGDEKDESTSDETSGAWTYEGIEGKVRKSLEELREITEGLEYKWPTGAYTTDFTKALEDFHGKFLPAIKESLAETNENAKYWAEKVERILELTLELSKTYRDEE